MPSRPIAIAVLACAAVLPAAFTLHAGFDPDTWWHLRVGQLIAETESVPATDPFSRLGREEPRPWVAYSWLFELGLYRAYEAFGAAGVLWVRVLLGAASTAAVLALLVGRRAGPSQVEIGWHGHGFAWPWSASSESCPRRAVGMAPEERPSTEARIGWAADWWTLVAIGLAAVTLMPLARERPWHLTIAFTCVTVAVVEALRGGAAVRRFAWLPLVFVVWANVHIQFVLGWLVLGLACVFPGKADRRHLLLLSAACGLAVLVNPYHVKLLGVIWEYATQTGPLRTVQELAPPDPLSPWFLAGVGLIGLGAVRAVRRRPVDWFAVAMLVVALVLMLRMRRDVWLAGVAAAVALRSAGAAGWRQSLGVIGLVVGVFVAVRFANLAGLGPSTDSAAANAERYPVRAVEFVWAKQLPGPLFNSFDWGGYLIWALPEHPVSIDGRTNVHGSDRVTRSMTTWAGESGWDADPDLRSAQLVIAPARAGLTARLRERPNEWRAVHEDATVVVFIRRVAPGG